MERLRQVQRDRARGAGLIAPRVDHEVVVDKQSHAVIGDRREGPVAGGVDEHPALPARGKII